MSRPAIATMEEPSVDTAARTMIAQVHFARDKLSLSERTADMRRYERGGNDAMVIQTIEEAISHLNSARATGLDCGLAEAPNGGRASQYLMRAVSSARISIEHLRNCQSYIHGAEHERDEQERALCEKRAEVARRQWRRSSEEAKKEAHQALAIMCEAFPDCFDRAED